MLIRYFAAAAQAAATHSMEIDADHLTVSELTARLGAHNPPLARILGVSALLADGVRVTGTDSLGGVDQLDVLPPFAGG